MAAAKGKKPPRPAAPAGTPTSEQAGLITRAQRVWSEKSHWDRLYNEAVRFAIPMRSPGGIHNPQEDGAEVMDMTSTESTIHFAGQLKEQLYPSGQPPANLVPGPLIKANFPPNEVDAFGEHLRGVQNSLHPYFQTGDFDMAAHEMCIELAFGTGAMLVHPGNHRNRPLRFASIPFSEYAVECDLFGDVTLMSWRRQMSRRAIQQAFPKGSFPDGYGDDGTSTDRIEQIFWSQDMGLYGQRWGFLVVVQNSQHVVLQADHRSRRIALPRYYRVSGESYGRGPLMLALPSIKTLNMAQELAFRSAAISMLGIWGFRAGSTFEPESVSLDAGAFWPMQSTGGMLGADVSRLDSATGNLNVAQLVIEDLKDQIRMALLDERLKPQRGTPASASEIAARMQQKADTNIGAFGRLVRETLPVIIPAAIDILTERNLMAFNGQVDELLIGLEVRSPMAAALNANRVSQAMSYFELCAAVDGENVDQHVKREALLQGVGELMQIDPEWVPNAKEREEIKEAKQAAQAAAMAMSMAGGDGGEGQPGVEPMAAVA
jgi:hypothetical protein